jgi:hypothetical protein
MTDFYIDEMTNLSPQAQAVLDATGRKTWYRNDDIVAALRAAADQVVPEFWHEEGDIYAETKHDVRADLLAIAAELEGE